MSLATGTKLGPYEITSPLGAGGMGEVYRARDTRLGRDVAIKVLPQHLSTNPDLKARFEREAKAISALSHPHICHLYDIGSQDGTDFLVMELLEGETLGQRIQRGPVPLAEELKIGEEVAEALEVAHRSGIVHRDLKPGNIMLTKTGAKLMDFGLAKPASMGAAAGSSSAPLLSAARTVSGPSPASPLTAAGTIVGTIQYMSPEQIEGKEADPRSDIFALGAVLYEMATGKRPFEGKSQISVASAILDKDPEPISKIQPLTPPVFEHVVERALKKNPEERWQSAADVRGELKWISEAGTAAAPRQTIAVPSKRERWAWIAAAIAIIAAIALAAIYTTREQPPAFPIRSQIAAPENANFVFIGDNGGPPALSPDGKMLAFVAMNKTGTQQIFVRPIDSLNSRVLAGTENAWSPFWSPDGKEIGFFADAKLKIVEAQGSTPIAIADAENGRGGSWSKDGTIIFAPDYRSPLLKVPAAGGTSVPLTKLDESKHTSHRWPFFLPDGKHFLYLAINHSSPNDPNDGIYFASLDGKENVRLTTAFSSPQYVNGSLLYLRSGELVEQQLDASSGKLNGDPQRVIDGIADDITTWRGIFTVSGNGLLAYSPGEANSLSQLVWYDRSGKPLGNVGDKVGILVTFALSPSADRIALNLENTVGDIWVQDVARNVRTRLTFGPVSNGWPVWSPDGKWIAYQTLTKGGNALARRPSGGGPEEFLLTDTKNVVTPTDWSRDGKYLLFNTGAVGTHTRLWALPLFGDRKPFELSSAGQFQQNDPHFSPDGKWVTYDSDESGRFEIYAIPFRGNGSKWQVSTATGQNATWRSDGKEIFYTAVDGTLIAAPVTEQGEQLKLGTPQSLFRTDISASLFGLYAAAPGGKKFLVAVTGARVSQPLTLIVNWQAELKK